MQKSCFPILRMADWRVGVAPGSEWILHGCDFGCDSDVILDVKIYIQILHGCELDVMRVDRIYQQILHGCESRCESVKIGGYCNGPNVNVECAIHIRSVQLHIVYIDILSRFVTLRP